MSLQFSSKPSRCTIDHTTRGFAPHTLKINKNEFEFLSSLCQKCFVKIEIMPLCFWRSALALSKSAAGKMRSTPLCRATQHLAFGNSAPRFLKLNTSRRASQCIAQNESHTSRFASQHIAQMTANPRDSRRVRCTLCSRKASKMIAQRELKIDPKKGLAFFFSDARGEWC